MVLSGAASGSYKRMGKLLKPIGIWTHVIESKWAGGYDAVLTVLDAGGYYGGMGPLFQRLGPGFPWHFEVYGDDVFPVPWP